MNKIFLSLLLLAFVAGAFFFYWSQPRKLVYVHPKIAPAVQAVYATGTVEPGVMLPIAPRTSARLYALNVDEGARVEKGQLLAQMEDRDIEKTVTELRARLSLAKSDYDRRRSLQKSGAVSTQSVDKARSDYDAAAAALERAEAERDYLQLTAPESGMIIKRDGEVGEFIPAGQPVFWIECCAPLRITAEVDEEDISLINPGQEVIIRADAFPGALYKGSVKAITPKGDPVTRSYRVRIALQETTPLMTGMTTETNIIIRKTDKALLVPANAVKDGKIWVLRDGMLKNIPVTIGARGMQSLEILPEAGLTTEDQIAADANDPLLGSGAEAMPLPAGTLEDWSPAP